MSTEKTTMLKEFLSRRTTERLKEELKELEISINVFQCFGSNDLILADAIAAEIKRRTEDANVCL
jgi:hypothetical protein